MGSVQSSVLTAPTVELKKKSQWVSAISRVKKNKLAMFGLALVILMILVAVFADVIAPYPYEEQHLADSLLGPCARYPFGTDKFGRCILSRVIYGARTSLLVGFAAVTLSTLAGGCIGAVAGYFGGALDNVLMRLIDIILSVPHMLLAISISAMMGTGLVNTIVAISIGGIGEFARITRASVLSVRDQEYVEAVKAISAGNGRIIFKHILPNILAPLIVQYSLKIASSILGAAGLSFVGLGVQPPTPEWGAMLSAGRSLIRYNWWLTLFPGLAIMITVYGFNLFGDGLRDALDPRLKD
ncbi:ABC transporter permease [Hominifimenecus sp. rT4P-3]|uniref:ABC transporter permease n=1 Tax=Hominifimenecus sp. rT4P-3 TaxID=3242979 RepID=UPI003DA3CE0E